MHPSRQAWGYQSSRHRLMSGALHEINFCGTPLCVIGPVALLRRVMALRHLRGRIHAEGQNGPLGSFDATLMSPVWSNSVGSESCRKNVVSFARKEGLRPLHLDECGAVTSKDRCQHGQVPVTQWALARV